MIVETVLDLGLVVVVGLATCALLLLRLARWYADRSGISADAHIVAADTYAGAGAVRQLRDPATGLLGQPDYVLRETVRGRARLVPMELKPNRVSERLHESDELQLVVYMILLATHAPDEFAGYGYVKYKTAQFRVQLTRERVERVLAVADAVRAARRAAVDRTHRVPGKCRGCAVRRACGQSLA